MRYMESTLWLMGTVSLFLGDINQLSLNRILSNSFQGPVQGRFQHKIFACTWVVIFSGALDYYQIMSFNFLSDQKLWFTDN